MLRSSLIAASSFALMASAAAQTPQQLNAVHKVPGAVKHAGIYHVATGTWTRTGGSAVSNRANCPSAWARSARPTMRTR